MHRTFATLLIVCALSFFVSLGSTPLWDPDEPRFAAATRDMASTGDVLTPRFNGVPRFEKPVLFYWLQLPFFLALGPSETAARLPSALAGVGCVVLLYLIGRSYFSDRAAFIASLALATVFRFVAYTRQGLTDVPAMFFEMAAIYFFRGASLADADRATKWAMTGWAAVALCALTKGPVAIIPIAIWGAYLAVTRDWASLARWRVIPGALLAAAICLPWYVVMIASHGREFLDVAIGLEVIQRAIDYPAQARGPLYYARVWPADGLPWTMFFLLGCAHALLTWKTLEFNVRRGLLLCGIWFAAVFVLFSLASGKLPHYVLPIYAPMALVAAFYIDRVALGLAPVRPWQAAAAVTGITLMVMAFVAIRFLNRATGAGLLDAGILLPGILGAGGVATLLTAARARAIAGTFVLIATLVSTYAFLTTYTLPRQLTGLYPTAQLGRQMSGIFGPEDRVCTSGSVPPPTLIFYSRHVVTSEPSAEELRRFLGASGRAFCMVTQQDLDNLRQSGGPVYEILRRRRLALRFNRLFGPRPTTLYDNDVIVVGNQPVTVRSALSE
jgi:4-amino-4-deoxy-L-arabinose transferase-like glycosyltransferase